MAFRWWAVDGPLIGGICIIPPLIKKKVIRAGPCLTKLSGSAHVVSVAFSAPSFCFGYQLFGCNFDCNEVTIQNVKRLATINLLLGRLN